MRIHNHSYSTIRISDLFVHLRDLCLTEVLRVKFEILVARRTVVLVCPLDVHPKNVDWKPIPREVAVALNHYVRTNTGIFAEVITKSLDHR